jgi:glycosyltransferase involved in cell wall biosynthesis
MSDVLVILTPGFPASEADTSWIPPQQVFVRALKRTYPKLNIVVLTLKYPQTVGEYNWHGVRVIAFAGGEKGGIRTLKMGLQVWHSLRELNKQYNIIGLLSFWLGEAAIIGSYFARWNKLKHYSWLLGQDAKAGNKYARWINPESDELIALSDFLRREYFKNYGVVPMHLVPVGIDASLFGVYNGERDIDILGAGSLIPLKRYHLFIKIVSLLKLLHPSIRAVLCGCGPELDRLKALITNLQLQNNITIKGELPHREVLALMQRTRVFIHPSEYEGFGAVCLEALYAGAQVVSFVKPMDAVIANWHNVSNVTEMGELVNVLLSTPAGNSRPVMPYPIEKNVRTMMQLFNYSE